MSGIEDYKIAYGIQQVDRAMSLLSLIESALTLEMNFQDEHVDRPIETVGYIPGLGEVIGTVVICREALADCWSELNRENFE